LLPDLLLVAFDAASLLRKRPFRDAAMPKLVQIGQTEVKLLRNRPRLDEFANEDSFSSLVLDHLLVMLVKSFRDRIGGKLISAVCYCLGLSALLKLPTAVLWLSANLISSCFH
jgi:hypothetical protein